MRRNMLREKMRDRRPTIGTRIMSSWPAIIEVIGHTGKIDYVEFVSEYGPYDLYDLENLARASELFDMSTMIKVDQSIQTYAAQRALGAGIQNVLFTDIRSVEDVKECVRIVRAETPQSKGINPCAMRRNVGYVVESGSVEYVEAMEEAVVAVMIEKASAMEHLEDILAVEGLDMVQFGPCDYAMSIGIAGQKKHPRVKEAEKVMIRTSLERGVVPRAEINNVEEAFEYIDLGVRHFSIGNELRILHDWLKRGGERLREELLKV